MADTGPEEAGYYAVTSAEVRKTFRLRRVLLVPLFFAPVIGGVVLFSVGLEIGPTPLFGVRGSLWASLGLLLISGAAAFLGWVSTCPACGRAFNPSVYVARQSTSCVRCGMTLGA